MYMFTLIQNNLANECVEVLYCSNEDDADENYNTCLIELANHFDKLKSTNASLSCVQVDKHRYEIYEYGQLFGKTKVMILQILKYTWNE
jgi:hypothetical protein